MSGRKRVCGNKSRIAKKKEKKKEERRKEKSILEALLIPSDSPHKNVLTTVFLQEPPPLVLPTRAEYSHYLISKAPLCFCELTSYTLSLTATMFGLFSLLKYVLLIDRSINTALDPPPSRFQMSSFCSSSVTP